VGSSIGEWQVMQPADLRSASLPDWPMLICGVAENPRKLVTSSAVDAHKNKAINKPGLPAHFFVFARWSSRFIGQKANFTEPNNENRVLPP
jgi:hypothetical protein